MEIAALSQISTSKSKRAGNGVLIVCLALFLAYPTWNKSVVGSRPYLLSYQHGQNGGIIPTITGQAFIMAESQLFFNENDPFKNGISH